MAKHGFIEQSEETKKYRLGHSFLRLARIRVMTDPIAFTDLDCHINDQPFVDKALEIFDAWIADGTIKSEATIPAPLAFHGTSR